jgi:transcriptional regulator with XRE-family HTH domain
MENFSERLKQLRKSQNVTQKELAQSLNVTERNYQSWEAGKTKPKFEAINALCNYFSCSADYLLGRTDAP